MAFGDFTYGSDFQKMYYTLYARVSPTAAACDTPSDKVAVGPAANDVDTAATLDALLTTGSSGTATLANVYTKVGEIRTEWGLTEDVNDTEPIGRYDKQIDKETEFTAELMSVAPSTAANETGGTEGNLQAIMNLDGEICDFVMVSCAGLHVHFLYRVETSISRNFQHGTSDYVTIAGNIKWAPGEYTTFFEDFKLTS